MKRLIYLKNWQSLDLLVSPLEKLSSHDFYCLRHTSIVTSLHSLVIAVTVRVNNHCPAILKLVAIYSWLPNNCLCIERYSSQHMQQCEKNVFNIFNIFKSWVLCDFPNGDSTMFTKTSLGFSRIPNLWRHER